MHTETRDDILARVIELITRSAKILEPGEILAPERDLLEVGIDSFGLLEIITDIEVEFDLVIPDEMLTRETFESARSVADAVHAIRSGAFA